MPAVHLRTVDEELKLAGVDVQIGVNVHAPDSTDDAFVCHNFRRSAEQNNGCELDRLIDQNLERMGA